MIAIARSKWMNPPKVKEVTSPKSQRIINMIAIVFNIKFYLPNNQTNATRHLINNGMVNLMNIILLIINLFDN